MSRVENLFMREGIKLCTSLVSPKLLKTEPLGSWGGAFKGSVPFLILLNTEDFGAPILVKTDGRFVELDGCNLSNTQVLVLGKSSSFSLLSIFSAEMCWTADGSYFRRREILIDCNGV